MKEIQKILKELIAKEEITIYRISRDLKIDHASLYRSLRTGENVKWNRVKKILKYLGYELKAIKSKGKDK
jgi:DNA-binding phage protein